MVVLHQRRARVECGASEGIEKKAMFTGSVKSKRVLAKPLLLMSARLQSLNYIRFNAYKVTANIVVIQDTIGGNHNVFCGKRRVTIHWRAPY